ncbi:hypothetical protein OS175_00650 [Marinicella sp. S1101]|uniref:hypothetical protein n=1 Tax=Marinicella marina TaxID=2996016 RepID=UPI002260945D|nr:hypothetical protein [Marinicella marina]MCX7552371.1 hypothetical protein [Marinicella marina]MDJ1139246.1 hypothetical protein [Marinicella marina]
MHILFFILLLTVSLFGTESQAQASADLPDKPADWVCSQPDESKTAAASQKWCAINEPTPEALAWRDAIGFTLQPGQLTEMEKKNAFDFQLRDFLRARVYDHKLNWAHDRDWRLTGPYKGPFGEGKSYGVHPAVRVYYSPEMVAWLCAGREGELPFGAMIIKEMANIDAALGVEKPDNCMQIKTDDQRLPSSWTVMYRTNTTHDGWYYANPTMTGDGNPPVVDKSAFTDPGALPSDPVKPNQHWFPTGYDFSDKEKINTIVYPYNLYGAACINCHATAVNEMTFSSLDNIVSAGLRYKWYPLDKSITAPQQRESLHSQPLDDAKQVTVYQPIFSQPLTTINPNFEAYFGDLGIKDYAQAWPLRFPAETFDHNLSMRSGLDQFLTSDQCINCHDATYANSAEANMLIDKSNLSTKKPKSKLKINVSPYGEWRVSPMGLAGRDPIFFSQLQSETNNLPAAKKCIENTCLHCHGVMGQRQLAIDTPASEACKDIFAVAPPEGVPFGQPMAKSMVTQWQDDPPNNHDAKYGALARDGISCMVCHQIDDKGLGTESGYTGNFVTNQPGQVVGPYASESVITQPMQNALDITPQFGAQIQNSDMCGSCHNILLPTFNNDGTPHQHTAPGGLVVNATYEQTTHLEWVNSDFSKKGSFESCQDCHMPTKFDVGDTYHELKDMRIANIESSDFAPTTHRLPNKDITLTPRDKFARHSLHGLNVFLNEMFQQFPMILGLRQMDYMVNNDVQPALITGRDSMIEMATQQTANVSITHMQWLDDNTIDLSVEIENKTGHFLPSGVGFRRVFIEAVAHGKSGEILWASGRSNALGVILEGSTDKPLSTEQGGAGQSTYQPHYQVIDAQDQVQIYQEIIQDSAGHNTTSFMRRVSDKKDNRIRAKGFDPQFYLDSQSPYIQMLGVLLGEAAKDKDYSDKNLTGKDRLKYVMKLSTEQKNQFSHVTVKLYNQSIPPVYLQDRFSDAHVGPAEKDDIQRLYYLTSHLNTDTVTAEGIKPIKDWRFFISGACIDNQQNSCED